MQVMLTARSASGASPVRRVQLRYQDLEPARLVLADEARLLREQLGDAANATLDIVVANDLGMEIDPRTHPWLAEALAQAREAFDAAAADRGRR